MDLRPFLESAVTVPYNKQRPLGRTESPLREDICLSSAGNQSRLKLRSLNGNFKSQRVVTDTALRNLLWVNI